MHLYAQAEMKSLFQRAQQLRKSYLHKIQVQMKKKFVKISTDYLRLMTDLLVFRELRAEAGVPRSYLEEEWRHYDFYNSLECFDLLEEAMVLDTKCKKLKKPTV